MAECGPHSEERAENTHSYKVGFAARVSKDETIMVRDGADAPPHHEEQSHLIFRPGT